jgi:hypothetical protein
LTAGSDEPTTHLSAELPKELAPKASEGFSGKRSSRKRSRIGKRYDKICHKVEQQGQDVPYAQSDRRGPPTDRPPDKPPPLKDAFKGSSYERASSRHVSQLASSRGSNGLSGKASPVQKCNFKGEDAIEPTPSFRSRLLSRFPSRA